MPKKLTQNEFIFKSNKVHSLGTYDYSKVEYKNIRTKVCIICPDHGEFWQTPHNHLQGNNCPKCSQIKKTKTVEKFIKESNKIHNNKYDYSKVKYQGANIKVCIICPDHGEFWQTPSHHLNKHKCIKCGAIEISKKLKKSVKEFIQIANKIHDNKYDYSKVEYVHSQTKVCIICPDHGEFWQTPSNHLQGKKCPTCSTKSTKLSLKLLTKKFHTIHNNFYNYKKVDYINYHTKVCIICPDHGEFWQTPANHMKQGCPTCHKNNFSWGEIIIEKHLKKLKTKFIPQKKFKDCRNKLPLPFDFYLPEYNICIEFDGKHHFGIGKFAKKSVNINDKIKDEYCKKNNIRLIRIPYWERQNISEILNKLIYY